jgi:nicotinate-nucleotide adenylyltransferase
VKIGFMGGSFDPVHLGHLLAARDACEHGGLDRVFFVPAARTPLKASAARASAADRLDLLRAAIVGEPRFAVSDHEIRRGGVSYTIDTVRHFRVEFPGARLHWIVGADQLARLPQWREIDALTRLAAFIVLDRPGVAAESPSGLPHLRMRHCRGHHLALSSTELRARVRRGQPIDWLTPHKVVELIRQRGLYR